MSRSLIRTVLFSLALSVAGVVAVLWWLGDPADLRGLLRLSLPTVAAAVGLQCLSFLAGGLRLRLLAAMAGERLGVWRSTRAFILGLFGAAVTPSGGGSGPAIALAAMRDGLSSPVAWSLTVYSTILDLAFMGWSVPAAALVLHGLGLLETRLLLLAALVGLGCLTACYALASHLPRVQRLGLRLFSVGLLRRWRRPAARFLAGVGEATTTVARGHAGLHLALQALSAVVHLAPYAILHLLLVSLGADHPASLTLAVMVLVATVSHVVPTPGGSGYTEFAMSYIFSQQAATATVAAAVVGYRALTFYAPLLLGTVLGGSMLAKDLARAPDAAPGEAPGDRDNVA